MRRRDALAFLGIALAAAPLALRAQESVKRVVGFLNGGAAGPFAHLAVEFRRGLGDIGYVEGRNLAIEYRWADGHYDRLPAMARDLVQRGVAVLVATGGENAGLAAKAATADIPIVFAMGGDPVALGLVASLSRPGGNLTGLTQFTGPLEAKRLGLLLELVPGAATIAVLVNPNFANAEAQLQDVRDAAQRAGLRLVVLSASSERDLETVFATLVRERADALVVSADPFFNTRREPLVALSARHKVPAVYEFREFAAAGGLMSYGTNLARSYRQIGVYTGRILDGAKPGDLPVLQPTKFDFVINLRTAKSLGLAIPQSLLLRADEVIR